MHTEHTHEGHGPDKPIHITVNGRPRTISEHRLTFSEVVELAFPGTPVDPNVVFTVSYADPKGHDGTLAEGQTVRIHEGMSFVVRKTARS
jgi:hypothetical protein